MARRWQGWLGSTDRNPTLASEGKKRTSRWLAGVGTLDRCRHPGCADRRLIWLCRRSHPRTWRGPCGTRYRLADGVTLTSIRYPRAPNEVRVLTLTQGHGAVPDVLPAGARYPAYAVPSRLASAAGALAAVNDDFSVQGRPKHLSMIDGELWTTGIQPRGPAFAFSAGGNRAFIGEPHPVITVLPTGGSPFDVDRWNASPPKRDQVAVFSLRGGSVEKPPGDPSRPPLLLDGAPPA